MLIIISDLHLTDGTSGTTIGTGAFEIFKDRITDMAIKASWRQDEAGKRIYEPIKTIDILLLGDVLDIIRSKHWSDAPNGLRPWSDPNSPEFIAMVQKINRDILKNNEASFAMLRALTQTTRGMGNEGKITIPMNQYEEGEKPKPQTKTRSITAINPETVEIPVKVRIHYMVGNHDWFYHLPGKAYDEVRRDVVRAMGLANNPNLPFPHSIEESVDLQQICRDHRVYPRHGDIHDPFNYDEDKGRDASSLGDVIVVELLNRFPAEVEQQMKGRLPEETISGLKEIDNVRPLMFIPIWINGLLNKTCHDKELAEEVQDIWNKMADDFLELPVVEAEDTLMPFESVDLLQIGLKITKVTGFDTISKVISSIAGKKGGGGETYYKQALKEPAYTNGEVDFVVYGHTHHQEIVPLEMKDMTDRFYFNTGTWRQVFELSRADRKAESFMGFQVMSYLGFFKEG
ncbi:MAG: hypothetical protein KDD99_27575, partial [Bacteroidetes bacterium]|nr:hypothetical protein [Bacteroidota bacterium]